jgi:hypothetical protein
LGQIFWLGTNLLAWDKSFGLGQIFWLGTNLLAWDKYFNLGQIFWLGSNLSAWVKSFGLGQIFRLGSKPALKKDKDGQHLLRNDHGGRSLRPDQGWPVQRPIAGSRHLLLELLVDLEQSFLKNVRARAFLQMRTELSGNVV